MSGRCKSCNSVMSADDMCRKWPKVESQDYREYCDLCESCYQIAIDEQTDLYLDNHDYWKMLLGEE